MAKTAAPKPRAKRAGATAPAQAESAGFRPAAAEFLAPRDLQRTESAGARVLALGSCLLEDLLGSRDTNADPNRYDLLLVNGLEGFPDELPADITAYDYQVLQIGLRFVVGDLVFAHLDYADLAGFQDEFFECCKRLRLHLEHRIRYNVSHGTLTFVMNFMQPQFNPMGRLLPRHDLRNIEYFVDQLNAELERLVKNYPNCYILDIDRLAASFGRRYIQDDTMTHFNHNARLPAGLELHGRMDALGKLSDYFEPLPGAAFSDAVVAELRAMHRSVQAVDSVKLVVVDLDDTLWTGTSGDIEDVGPFMAEGWPRGLLEALLYLKKRGVLLAVASKNDEARIRAIWPRIFTEWLPFSIFADARINWQPKVDNMRAMLRDMNLLPRNTVFIDDNPAERAEMQAAFPDMRILGRNPFQLRRILMLAPETQGAAVSSESARRTDMMQAQIRREAERAALPPEAFARDQNVKVRLSHITSVEHTAFARALELINKTNQFNTSGKRWPLEQCRAHFAAGGVFIVYHVEGRHTAYGLVGVAMVLRDTILQWVMSCRVIGLGVEQTALHGVVATLRQHGAAPIWARLVKTELNATCQAFYKSAGFIEQDGMWMLAASAPVPRRPDAVMLEGV